MGGLHEHQYDKGEGESEEVDEVLEEKEEVLEEKTKRVRGMGRGSAQNARNVPNVRSMGRGNVRYTKGECAALAALAECDEEEDSKFVCGWCGIGREKGSVRSARDVRNARRNVRNVRNT